MGKYKRKINKEKLARITYDELKKFRLNISRCQSSAYGLLLGVEDTVDIKQ